METISEINHPPLSLLLSIPRHRLFIECIPFKDRFYVYYNYNPLCFHFHFPFCLYRYKPKNKTILGVSCFFSNFILLKVLGLDNATRFFLPLLSLWFLWSSRNIRCDSQFSWLARLKYNCPLYFSLSG